jgi:hypothetical protein
MIMYVYDISGSAARLGVYVIKVLLALRTHSVAYTVRRSTPPVRFL